MNDQAHTVEIKYYRQKNFLKSNTTKILERHTKMMWQSCDKNTKISL